MNLKCAAEIDKSAFDSRSDVKFTIKTLITKEKLN